jgi:protein KRI1
VHSIPLFPLVQKLTIAVEEKYGRDADESDEDSEAGVEEDDAGELVTEALDAEIFATLNAIRSKDPRVYNKDISFYQSINDDEGPEETNGTTKEKPMTLKDYHTKNLLEGKFDPEEDYSVPVRTHQQELDEAKQEALNAIKAAAGSDDDEEEDFLVAKSKPAPKKRVKITEEDVEKADKDPETFLSNFMAARAWVPTGESHWKPLESDDEEEEERAEEYESAYNLYFEDPAGQNEKIVTYARDAVASTTVRREEKNARRKAREAARAKREAEKREREEELARLRKLRVEEMEDKVKQIRKLGGFSSRDFKIEDWSDVLEADWSDNQWDEEMRKRFGDAYYEDGGDDDSEAEEKKKKKPKKPVFDDDIDIKDIIPDYDEGDDEAPPLTSDEEEGGDVEDGEPSAAKSSKKRKQERADAKSAARRDRRLIEKLVDSNLEYDAALASKKGPTGFRYRETSPTTFGLTPRDILLASDSQLNEFAGLKKLAAFRDPVKKKKDKKHLSKKARLRQWRMDTFGDEEGPKGGFELLVGDEEEAANGRGSKRDKAGEVIREGDGDGKRKKKRSRKRKTGSTEV